MKRNKERKENAEKKRTGKKKNGQKKNAKTTKMPKNVNLGEYREKTF